MTKEDKLKKALALWREAIAHKAKGESLVLELMRHPDTSLEQLQDCRRVMLKVEGMLEPLTTQLRKAFPEIKNYWGKQYPWHDPAFNRYDISRRAKQ